MLRPGGALRFVEHGRSPDTRVARMQHGLTPLHRRAVGGCRLDRPIADLIGRAGFRLTRLENYHFHRPRAVGYTYEGPPSSGQAAGGGSSGAHPSPRRMLLLSEKLSRPSARTTSPSTPSLRSTHARSTPRRAVPSPRRLAVIGPAAALLSVDAAR